MWKVREHDGWVQNKKKMDEQSERHSTGKLTASLEHDHEWQTIKFKRGKGKRRGNSNTTESKGNPGKSFSSFKAQTGANTTTSESSGGGDGKASLQMLKSKLGRSTSQMGHSGIWTEAKGSPINGPSKQPTNRKDQTSNGQLGWLSLWPNNQPTFPTNDLVPELKPKETLIKSQIGSTKKSTTSPNNDVLLGKLKVHMPQKLEPSLPANSHQSAPLPSQKISVNPNKDLDMTDRDANDEGSKANSSLKTDNKKNNHTPSSNLATSTNCSYTSKTTENGSPIRQLPIQHLELNNL